MNTPKEIAENIMSEVDTDLLKETLLPTFEALANFVKENNIDSIFLTERTARLLKPALRHFLKSQDLESVKIGSLTPEYYTMRYNTDEERLALEENNLRKANRALLLDELTTTGETVRTLKRKLSHIKDTKFFSGALVVEEKPNSDLGLKLPDFCGVVDPDQFDNLQSTLFSPLLASRRMNQIYEKRGHLRPKAMKTEAGTVHAYMIVGHIQRFIDRAINPN